MTPVKYNEFLNSLKVGSKIAVYESGWKPSVLTEVTEITDKYIKLMCHPDLKFDRQTGDDLPIIKNGSIYRYLFVPVKR